MSIHILGNTIRRIIGQLRHDPRTIAMIIVVPTVLIALLYYMFNGQGFVFDRIALIMLGVFPFIVMFLITSIAMLRERTSGTLERLFTTPVGRLDLLFGYGIAFGMAAAVQAGVASAVAYWVFDMRTAGSIWLVILIAVANAVLGVALGLLCSAFARTEFQAVQFMPVVAAPQLLLCGLFVARDQMAGWLQAISNVLPLSYSVQALTEVGAHTEPTGTMWRDLLIVLGAIILALALGAATLRRRTA
jgi:ABC-2 type transport system permease protein